MAGPLGLDGLHAMKNVIVPARDTVTIQATSSLVVEM